METKSIPFTVIGDHGRVLSTGFSMILPPATAGLVLEQQAPSIDHWWNGEAFVDKGPQPSVHHVFDWPTHQWVDPRDLATWQAQKWAEIKAARDAAMLAGVATRFGRFDADPTAALNVTATYTALDAQPDDWTVNWTRYDNTTVNLDKDGFREVALLILAFGNATHEAGVRLRRQIEAATSIGEVVGLHWPSPWPPEN